MGLGSRKSLQKSLIILLRQSSKSIHHFHEKVHLQMAAVADCHPTRAPTQMLPRLRWAFKVEPAQLAGGRGAGGFVAAAVS